MSIEEKAKAYDEALKKAKRFHTPDSNNTNLKAVIENIFPELKESEDERIRKWLITELHHEHDMVETDSLHPENAYKRKEMIEKCIIYDDIIIIINRSSEVTLFVTEFHITIK